jgi:hypothetical protein
MKDYSFNAVLQPGEGCSVYIAFPFDAVKEFGKSRVRIQCTIDGEAYRGTMIKYKTPYHIIIVLKAIREKIMKGAGDTVRVWLKEDKEERTVEVPDDFRKLLKKNKLETGFDEMSYSHRKEWMLWINGAKKIETRANRMEKAIDKLKEKLK